MEVLEYILGALISTLTQILIVFVPFLILATIMQVISTLIEQFSIGIFGLQVHLYGFASLGTAVHEIGHAMFCPVFGHKITEMKLFSIDYETGTLGYVCHDYNPKNIYHLVGNFFISVGPIVLGSILLFLIVWLLFGINLLTLSDVVVVPETFTRIDELQNVGLSFYSGFVTFLETIFSGNNQTWKIVLFIYLMFSIGSSMKLSIPDIRSALAGFIFIVIFLLISNLATKWSGNYIDDYGIIISQMMSGFYFIMFCAIGIGLAILAVLFLFSMIANSRT